MRQSWVAQDVARDMISDINPRWILLVGIAGGVPSDEYTLGDVIVANRIYDFTREAIQDNHPTEYDVAGGPAHKDIQNLLSVLPGMDEKLGTWNTEESISMSRPPVDLSKGFYGPKKWQEKVKESLTKHFGELSKPRFPNVSVGPIASSDRLIKRTQIIQAFMSSARSIRAVEMELAGVYLAARRTDREYPVLAIRGLSDIVGFKRDDKWTTYACHSAAAFTYALVKTRPTEPINKENTDYSAQYPPLFLAPPRPYGYKLAGRDKILQDLKQRLFAGGNLALSALNGLPGVGKTALAIELAHDLEVRKHFKDGVLWTGLGRDDPDILSRLGKWGIALGIPSEQRANLTGVKEWAETIHNTIGMKRMLLVADDAWQVKVALSFRLGGPNCAHLVTTRIPKVAIDFAGETTTVHELSNTDGLALLAQFIPEIVKTEPDTMRELERAVGGLPLALILMGKYLRVEAASGQPRRLRAALDRLQKAKERLQLDESQAPLEEHPSLPAGARISLPAVIGISDEALGKLGEEVRSTFQAISVFPPKPNTFSEEAAWAVSKSPTKTLNTLYDYGLLESSGPGRYTLHQAIQEYAKVNLTDHTPYERRGKFFSNLLAPYQKPYAHFDKNILANIEPEEENIKASLTWYQEQGMWDEYISLALGFCSYVGYISRWQEEIEWGKKVGDAADKISDNLAKAHVYCHVLPWPMWMRGEYEQARESCRIGIEAAQKLSDIDRPIYLSLAHHNLHRTALQECQNTNDRDLIASRLREMRLYGEQCLEFAIQTEGSNLFETLLGLAYNDIGFTALKVGNYREAEPWFRKRLELVKKTNNQVQIACRLFDVSLPLIGQKRFPEAKSLLEEAQTIAEDWKRGDLSAELLFGLARIERETGNMTHAEELERQARQFWNELGFIRDPFVYILNKPEFYDIY